MRRADFAEWILSQVTTPERAAATVGDLLESAPRHHAAWFWTSVVSTAVSFLARDLTGSPWRLARLAAAGIVLELAVVVVALGLVGVVVAIRMWAAMPDASGVLGAASVDSANRWLDVSGSALTIGLQFVVGRWLARKAPGQELAACAALMVLESIVGFAAGTASSTSLTATTISLISLQLVWGVPLLAGALTARRSQLV